MKTCGYFAVFVLGGLMLAFQIVYVRFPGNAVAIPKPKAAPRLLKVPSNCTSRCCLKPLKEMVLVVNFNNPHYSSIPILKQFYEPVFGKVVFCGNKEDKAHNVIGVGEKKYGGWLGYNCISKASKLHPNYAGYIHSNDDVIINWWTLWQYDMKKVWFHQTLQQLGLSDVATAKKDGWWWWKPTNTLNAFQKSLKELTKLSQSNDPKAQNSKVLLNNYYKYTSGKTAVTHSYADIFYIPHNMLQSFVTISEIFAKHSVFLEVAVPTLFMFLGRNSIVLMKGVYVTHKYGIHHPKYLSGEVFYEMYNYQLTYIHPFKFERGMTIANKNMFRNIMFHGDMYKKYCTEFSGNRRVSTNLQQIDNSSQT